MNKQDNRLAFSVVATLISGLSLIYTFIMFPKMIFAIAGVSLVFIVASFILTQNILAYASDREKSINNTMKDGVDYITNQMEAMNASQSQLDKATFLYTKQVAKTLSTLENNYLESQEALYKNLTEISNTQNKSTKLMIKYNQSTATKMISTMKDLRNQLSETMIQGFDQIQPDNEDIIETLKDIVNYLKTQSSGMEQSMGIQLNNVAHELQNISSSIQRVQVSMPAMSQAPVQPVTPTITQEAAATATTIAETPATQETAVLESTVTNSDSVSLDTSVTTESIPDLDIETSGDNEASDTSGLSLDEAVATKDEEPSTLETPSEDPNKQLSPDEIAALFAAAEPTPKKTEQQETVDEEQPFTPTFTVVGKEEPEEVIDEEPEAETSDMLSSMDDPNKQLSPDEIAALFAAADPAPKKAEKAPEPIKVEPISDDPNKQLSPDEIAALFAAADPAPKKEEPVVKEEPVATAPVMDDPNRQLSPDEIAALFASMG